MSSDQNFKLLHQGKQKDNTASGLEKHGTDFPVHLRASGCPSVSLASPSTKQTVWSHQCLKHSQLPSQQDLSFMQALTLPAWFFFIFTKALEGRILTNSYGLQPIIQKHVCFLQSPFRSLPQVTNPRGQQVTLHPLPSPSDGRQGDMVLSSFGRQEIFMTLTRGGWERLEFGQCVLKNSG